ANLLTQGMVLNHIFHRTPTLPTAASSSDGATATTPGRREYFNPVDVDLVVDAATRQAKATLRKDGSAVDYEGLGTMSKSRNNGVDPNLLTGKYGADTARLFMMFTAPPEQTLEWSDEGVLGANRFLRRVWKAVYEHVSAAAATSPLPALDTAALDGAARDLRRIAHQTLGKVKDDIGRRQVFNTAIAAVMELLNAVARLPAGERQARAVRQEALTIAVLCLSPIVPHIAHALWQELGHREPLHRTQWLPVDPAALTQQLVEIVVQVNGKLRGRISLAPTAADDELRAAALADPQIQRHLEGREPVKVIVVRGKLVNVVV
ncbi:MAG: class I tRNA ligase family protein, partial [Pseudomonadota bacterium]